jgi:hypothetical protein
LKKKSPPEEQAMMTDRFAEEYERYVGIELEEDNEEGFE